MVRQRKGPRPEEQQQQQQQQPGQTETQASGIAQDTPARPGPPSVKPQPAADGAAATQPPGQPPQGPSQVSLLQLGACIAAALLLLLVPRAANHLLAPQTGGWLAGLASGLLLALGPPAVATGMTACLAWPDQDTAAGSGPAQLAAPAMWAAAALLLASRHAVHVVGGLLLSPGLAADPSRRLTDTWITLRCLLLGLLCFAPAVLCLGFATGAAGCRALRPLHAKAHRALVPALAALAVWAVVVGAPSPLPKPGCTGPAAAACVAALLAAVIGGPAGGAQPAAPSAAPAPASKVPGGKAVPNSHKKKPSSSTGRQGIGSGATSLRWAAVAAVFAAAAWQAARCYPCHHYDPPLSVAGQQYTLLYSCETALGPSVSVVEGLMGGRFRYRLMRVDHTLMGGEYVSPASVAGQSVYTAFYLQQAVLAARPLATSTLTSSPQLALGGTGAAAGAPAEEAPGSKLAAPMAASAAAAAARGRGEGAGAVSQRPRSLHIGLGVGTAVKGLQAAGTVADVLELYPEVVAAARDYFGVRPLGRTIIGDALHTLDQLPHESYDYVIHDIFSGGGATPPLMREAFFRRLRRKVAPGGVVAVNYMGGKGQPLKELWCRLRLAFEHVRCFADAEASLFKNYVLFASDASLAGMESAAAQMLRPGGAASEWDPPAADALRNLPKSEVKFTYDKQRCYDLLGLEEEAAEEARRAGRSTAGAGGRPPAGLGLNLPRELREAAETAPEQAAPARKGDLEGGNGGAVGAAVAGGKGGVPPGPELVRQFHEQEALRSLQAHLQRTQGPQEQGGQKQKPPPGRSRLAEWVVDEKRGHALAMYHWVVMRRQLDDELWQTY